MAAIAAAFLASPTQPASATVFSAVSAGDGTTTDRSTSVDVTGLASGVAAVSGDSSHTCAVTTAGGVKCWGNNLYGQLGDGTNILRTTPVDVTGLNSSAAAVSTGYGHTCALTTAGGVKCWGRNVAGQLGDGTTADRSTPAHVSDLTSGVAAVSVGSDHTCAVTTVGGLKCWGWNGLGQLGDGTTTDRSTPVDVTGLTSGVAAVSAGSSHTCSVTTAGDLECWGYSGSGQLGDGTAAVRATPVDVIDLTSDVAGAPIPCVSHWGLIAMAGMMWALLVWQRRRIMRRQSARR